MRPITSGESNRVSPGSPPFASCKNGVHTTSCLQIRSRLDTAARVERLQCPSGELSMLHTVLAGRVEPTARPWMVVLADARVLGESYARAPSESDPAVKTLVSHGVPVILLSCDRAERVRAVQSALGIRAPFISAGGMELHVPVGYFDEIRGLRQPSDDWNVIGFRADGDAPGF